MSEMRIARDQYQPVSQGDGSDPNIILGDWLAFPPKFIFNLAVASSRPSITTQYRNSRSHGI